MPLPIEDHLKLELCHDHGHALSFFETMLNLRKFTLHAQKSPAASLLLQWRSEVEARLILVT
jgi:hypothetical protein